MRSDTLVSANMATTESCQNITANVNSLSINGDHGDNNVGKSPLEKLWGFQLEELYRLALAFYKGNAIQSEWKHDVIQLQMMSNLVIWTLVILAFLGVIISVLFLFFYKYVKKCNHSPHLKYGEIYCYY